MSLQWRFLVFICLEFLSFNNFLCSQNILTLNSDLQPKFACKPPDYNAFTFCNTSLPIPVRAQSLISSLTLSEKIQQLSNNASAIPRLGIPRYEWWNEALHGIATNGPGVTFDGPIPAATSFPQVILQAASFNRTLWFSIASAIAVEARAMYNVGQAGLTFWAPNVNIFRDPRWGRGQETPGEDPMVASAYAIEIVKGLQGENRNGEIDVRNQFGGKRVLKGTSTTSTANPCSDRLMVSACCKHVTAYDLEKWGNFTRYNFNAVVSKQDLEDTYQAPFRSCVEQGKASCLMCSYNEVNGVPACARKDLLEQVRSEWGFQGYITSDCDAVATIREYQHYVETNEDAVADALKAGVDINCGTFVRRNTQSTLDQGKLKEDDIDKALFNLFSVQLRLGMFDGNPRDRKFGHLGPQHVCTAEHKKLALEAARQGIVLLKNYNKFLPLNKESQTSIAVIGPLAKNGSILGGGYSGVACSQRSLFDGLQEFAKEASYAAGCKDIACESDVEFDEAVRTAKDADIVIIVAGIDLTQETEDLDRVSLLLPGKQTSLISAVVAASRNPVILVVTGGGPVDILFAERNPLIASILWIGYPGETGGKALAEIIFGEVNPAGRLPVTWYPESFTNVPMYDMSLRADPSRGYPGRTYRFYTGPRIYGFGHGLSYSKFSYKFLSAPSRIHLSVTSKVAVVKNVPNDVVNYIHLNDVESCDSLRFSVNISVTNHDDMEGSHVLMLFSRGPKVFHGTPEKQLIGFHRLRMFSNQAAETSMAVDPCKHFSIADKCGERILSLGDHVLLLENAEHTISVNVY